MMEFSDKVKEFLNTHFPNKDIYSMSLEELEFFKREVTQKRQEYSLLEMGSKILANAAYGACASPYFFFFNPWLAGDITGECRELTQTMWKNLENFFKNTIWERKDLWEKFDFALDENKRETLTASTISCYSDTDSVYTTYGPLFHCMTPEYQKKYESDEAKIDFILRFNKEFLDKQNNQWCEELYGPRFGKNVHEFELETISKSQIVIKKKKYLKGLVYNKGKILKTPKVSGTGIEIIKSTTPKLCREILSDLMRSLMFDFDENRKEEFILEFNEKLKQYKKQFYNAPYEDISQSVGIGDYKKFVINDDDMLEFEKRVPPSVHAIARFNYLAKKNGEKQKCLYSGKIKYYNVRIGQQRKNPTMGFFGFPAGELPDWRPEMDKLVQWEKTVINPINRFLGVMNIPLASAYDQVQMSLFDWSDFQ